MSKRIYVISSLIFSCAMFWSCAAENSAEALECWTMTCKDSKDSSDSSREPDGCNYYKDELQDAPHCYNYGETMWVKDEDKIYVCEDNGFTQEGYWNSHPELSDCDDYVPTYNLRPDGCDRYVDYYQDIPSCYSYGATVWVKNENTIYVCEENDYSTEGNWVAHIGYSDCYDYVPSHSSTFDYDWSSSSSDLWSDYSDESSSSNISLPESNPSSSVNLPCGDLWCGASGQIRVETSLDNGTETSGFWFKFGDDADGGLSSIIWPVALGNEFDVDAIDPVIAYCHGICGIAHFSEGTLTYRPYVGIGFLIAGEKNLGDGRWDNADVSDWQGICVVYSSDRDIRVEMSLGEERDADFGNDVPVDTLYRSGTVTMQNIPWGNFEQRGFGKSGTITGYQASMGLAALKFIIEGIDGAESGFNIISVGRYGSCETSGK